MNRTLRWFAPLALLLLPLLASAQVPRPGQFYKIFSGHRTTANGVPMFYVIGGKGSPVVLLHGFPETWYAWRNIMPTLAEHHTVIAIDLPGVGTVEKPEGGFDTATMAEDLHQLILQLGFRDIDLVAHDVGVAVAYAYASDHRDEVKHLALFDVPPQGSSAFAELAKKAWAFSFQSQPRLPEDLVRSREEVYMIEGFFRPLAFDFAKFSPADIREYVKAYQVPGTMHAAFEWYRHFPDDAAQNKPQLEQKLTMPVLMLGGAKSGGPLMQKTADEIAIAGQAEVIADCGHWLMDEKPAEVLSYLVPFLSKAPGPY